MNYCWIIQNNFIEANKWEKKQCSEDLKSILLYNVNCLNTVQISLCFFHMIQFIVSQWPIWHYSKIQILSHSLYEPLEMY